MTETSRMIDSMSVKNFIFWLVLVFSALLAGLVAALLPYWLVIAVVAAPFFPILALNRPEYAILGVVAIGSGLIKAQFLPMLPVFGGSVTPQDLALLVMIPIVVMKSSSAQWSHGLRPFVRPLSFLFALILLSMVNSFFLFGTSIKEILGESRHFLHWLILPMLVVTLDDEVKLTRFIKSIWKIAIVFSLGQIIQSATGVAILGQDEAADVSTLGHLYVGFYRGVSSGVNFSVLALYLLVAGYLLNIRQRVWFFPLSILFSLAILVSFGRGLWATTVLGMVIMIFMAGFNKAPKLIAAALLMMFMAIAVMGVFKPASLLALEERASSVGEETQHGSSLGWRFYETNLAMEKLRAYPVLGIGLGTSYRPISASVPGVEATKYMHNGFIYMVLKLGTMALLVIIGIVIAFINIANGLMRLSLPVEYQVMILACTALFIQLMVLSVTQPEFLMKSNGIGLIAILAGILSVISNFHERGIINSQRKINL